MGCYNHWNNVQCSLEHFRVFLFITFGRDILLITFEWWKKWGNFHISDINSQSNIKFQISTHSDIMPSNNCIPYHRSVKHICLSFSLPNLPFRVCPVSHGLSSGISEAVCSRAHLFLDYQTHAVSVSRPVFFSSFNFAPWAECELSWAELSSYEKTRALI